MNQSPINYLDPEGLVTRPLEEGEIQTIDVDSLVNKINANENLQLLNVMDPKDYDLGSIRNSICIPLTELEARIKELDDTREVVTFCKGYGHGEAKKAAMNLELLGFKVFVYEGGFTEWRDLGYPIELLESAA